MSKRSFPVDRSPGRDYHQKKLQEVFNAFEHDVRDE